MGFRIFYSLPQSDIIERNIATLGLSDILTKSKMTVYTELSQLKGEKIDIAYITYNEQLLSHLSDLNVKKISIISKGDDDIFIPKNYVKYSSEQMMSINGTYNIILNHKTYKPDVEIIMRGEDNIYQDVARNVYALYGNVITSTFKTGNIAELESNIKARNLPNSGNVYSNVKLTLDALKTCTIKKYVIKVNAGECYANLAGLLNILQNGDKLVCSNVCFKKIDKLKYALSDHIIAGKYEQMFTMYSNAFAMLNNRLTDIRKKLRIEYLPEQILTIGYLKDKLNYIKATDVKYIKEVMSTNFQIMNIMEFGLFRIPMNNTVFTNGFAETNKEQYSKICEVNHISEI